MLLTFFKNIKKLLNDSVVLKKWIYFFLNQTFHKTLFIYLYLYFHNFVKKKKNQKIKMSGKNDVFDEKKKMYLSHYMYNCIFMYYWINV